MEEMDFTQMTAAHNIDGKRIGRCPTCSRLGLVEFLPSREDDPTIRIARITHRIDGAARDLHDVPLTEWLAVSLSAMLAGVAEPTIYKAIRTGNLKADKPFGGDFLIRPADLKVYSTTIKVGWPKGKRRKSRKMSRPRRHMRVAAGKAHAEG